MRPPPLLIAPWRIAARFARRLPIAAATTVLVACGGAGEVPPPRAAPLSAAPAVARGTLLQTTWSAYPRLVRLAHQADSRRNGRIVASVSEYAAGTLQAGFHVSSDDGASFARLGTLHDDAFATGLCCGTLFELPQAVGVLPAGTLLYAASVGADRPGTLMEQRLYRSDDGGATFGRIAGATCGTSAVPRVIGGAGSGVWEPEFLVSGDGALVCIYSDETEPGKSQVLKLTATADGTNWSAPEVVVAGAAASDRPGMAVVRRLPSGRYAMSFELCSTARLDCAARLLISDDGLHWGALGSIGTRPQTAAGQYFRHAPTIAWSPSTASAHGVVALIGQIVGSDLAGADLSGNGRVMLVNDDVERGGDWRAVAAPIGPASAPTVTDPCRNYSTPLLPSTDGAQILLLQTDLDGDGACAARFGRGPLAP
jgi:hypothetical protein